MFARKTYADDADDDDDDAEDDDGDDDDDYVCRQGVPSTKQCRSKLFQCNVQMTLWATTSSL